MKRRRHLYQSKHPFDDHPFEAFFHDSWRTVELIRIEDGTMTMHLKDNQCYTEERRPFSNLRIRSRKATSSDCTCFLRPGIDVCVLSASQDAECSDEENEEPVWVDAKISSIERKPHEGQCSCQLYVKFYINPGPLGSERGALSKETKLVGIDQITILQKLGRDACEDQYYRWNFSEDCSSLQKTKLLLGKFSSDLSFLLVASVLKQTAFDIRSVQKKIVYQVLGSDDDNSSPDSINHLNAINFKVEDGVSTSHLFQFIPPDTKEVSTAGGTEEVGLLPIYDVMNLRRSKRRNVQPDRFIGCDIPPESDIGWVRMFPIKSDKWEEEEEEEAQEQELYLPLSHLLDGPLGSSLSEENAEVEIRNPIKRKSQSRLREMESGLTKEMDHASELAIVPVPTEGDPLAFYPDPLPSKTPSYLSRKINEVSPKFYLKGSHSVRRCSTSHSVRGRNTSHSVQRRTTSEFEDKELDDWWEEKVTSKKVQGENILEVEDMGLERRSWGRPSNKKVKSNKYRPVSLKSQEFSEKKTHKKSTLSAVAFNRLINSYMKNIDSTITDEEPNVVDQWNEFKAAKSSEQTMEIDESSSENESEVSENEPLWKEMELAMAEAYILEDNEGSNAGLSSEDPQISSIVCQHEFTLDEEIGILCPICGFVKTEIKYVTPAFLEPKSWITSNKVDNEEDTEHGLDSNEGLNLCCNLSSSDILSPNENDNVWALIPELKMKLHLHQKKAFEFLWRNIAGSLVPASMDAESKNTGGCVISHTPGAGKTFLIIAFLVSYLKLFPGKRPLVLAPKTTLYTWHKEFIKWKIPLPVHLIHGRRTYRVFRQKRISSFKGGVRPTLDVMHVLDCLEKIQKWHAQPSILVMGYTSFLTLIREDAKFAHRKYMAKVLRESPGIVVLDEGHNPRSTKSRLRKALMKVETDQRVLLSGTLFQNNFCEYFNTLCLARPKFIHEVLRELDQNFKRKKMRMKNPRQLESRARKFFVDTIARKINSDDGEERIQGLNMLRNITSGFIDVYEGGASDNLPGLQIYTLLMNSTEVQVEVLEKLQKIMSTYNGYPLELELLITLAAIHPWLVKTSNCVNKFFDLKALARLEKHKYEIRKGSKVMFVLNLVHRVIKQEKVLMFCHNIAPIMLFAELFEKIFRWQKGREILILTGDIELFERGRIMDKFEEPSGPSRILIASITACAEGISLTAASRVIMLDSEWNPSKTKQAIARAFRPGQQKMVYVYQLLASGTLEEDKYRRTTWKEWVSRMIFSEELVEDPSRWQAEKMEDDVLREIVAADRMKSFHMIMKNEKASTN
ncbi:SNF2 domain-containing protein CLASSY 1 [Citrus sinensis]|uniref:SNF2 domain-containing protein CLASSY 1 n=1 Tax=Citrus sinensis TaxID=2711 RepID=A0ACB8L1K8_CITSI|nr:SNF2 domain-containing protein CLASSY 1 [Citrus sinensis]